MSPDREREVGPKPGGWASLIVARVRRDVPLALLDLAIVFVAYLTPLVLRLEGAVPPRYWTNFLQFIPVIGFLHLLTNYLFGLYGQMWRYASVQEARRVIQAGILAGLAVVAATLLIGGTTRLLPLSVVILGAALSLMGVGALRFQSRLFGFRRRSLEAEPMRVLVVGAGDAGSMVLKDLLRNPSLGLDPVGFVDDNPRKVGLSLHGVPVLGTRVAIPRLVARLRVDQVLLAVPSAKSEVVRHVAALCEEAGVTLRVLPSVRETVGGRITARDIRDLQIEDLLGRQQVQTDLESVRGILSRRRVLVSGAGGSIGSEIVRQVLSFEPSSLLLLDHDETHLHDLLTEIDGRSGAEMELADIRDQDRILSIFMTYRPEVVFHAAAHKHVDLLESHPEEALRTNVIGTANVTDAAVATGVGRFVLISTDKAVRPASVMGASKWFAEQIVRCVPGSDCVFCAVRFGNVLGSRGSVIPTFFRQIAQGGPVTVTHPSMARYFMSVEEAVQLVLQAAALSKGGEVFTLDMGEPMNILDLAKKVIRLSGLVPDRDVQISFVGTRPGEKLVEDVLDPGEEPLPSGHPGIIASRPPLPDPAVLRRAIRELEGLASQASREELAARIKMLAGEHVQPLAARAEL
ncbi:MAG: polysaccharide biosynthesis protein [Actinomycetota bacterium]